MGEFNFYLEHDFMDLNKYINKERIPKRGRFIANKIKQDATLYVAKMVMNKHKMIDKKCDVEFIWHETNQKVDPDNVAFCCKYVLDGLVSGGILKNDSHKYIKSIHHYFEKADVKAVTIKLTY